MLEQKIYGATHARTLEWYVCKFIVFLRPTVFAHLVATKKMAQSLIMELIVHLSVPLKGDLRDL